MAEQFGSLIAKDNGVSAIAHAYVVDHGQFGDLSDWIRDAACIAAVLEGCKHPDVVAEARIAALIAGTLLEE